MPIVRSSPTVLYSTPDLHLSLPRLGPEAFEALRTLEQVMMGPGDLETFQQRLNNWASGLKMDPVFQDDWLSDVLTCLVMAHTRRPERLAHAMDVLLAKGAMLDHVPPTGGDYLLSRLVNSDLPGRWDVAQLLLDRGADPLQNRNGKRPWIVALADRQHAFVSRVLTRAGTTRPNLDDALYLLIAGHGAAEDVEQRPLVPVALTLLAHGAPIDSTLYDAGTPFVQAVSHGHLDLAQALLDQGADRHATRPAIRAMDNDQGWTALHLVAAEDNPTACAWLIERGLDPQARSFNGATPLVIAREHEAWSAVALLERLELQQDLHAATSNTPGDRARARL